LSASQALQELAYEKENLAILCKRENLVKLVDRAMESPRASSVQSLSVLNRIMECLANSKLNFYITDAEAAIHEKLDEARN